MEEKDYLFSYYEIPEDDSIIWRYLDLAKFVSFLKDKSLFMTRADHFDDKFEGAVCSLKDKDAYDAQSEAYYSQLFEGKVSSKDFVEGLHKGGVLFRKNSFINCWCESAHESMAMWQLYSGGFVPKGVAIKSTVGRLRKSIGKEVEIGRIKYVNYDETWSNVNEALWRKRLSFEYEREVRIRIITDGGLSQTPPECRLLPVDLNILIDSVYISPMAEEWFKDVVEDIMKKYEISKDVHHSRLDDKALY